MLIDNKTQKSVMDVNVKLVKQEYYCSEGLRIGAMQVLDGWFIQVLSSIELKKRLPAELLGTFSKSPGSQLTECSWELSLHLVISRERHQTVFLLIDFTTFKKVRRRLELHECWWGLIMQCLARNIERDGINAQVHYHEESMVHWRHEYLSALSWWMR